MFKLTEEEWLAVGQRISMSSQFVMTYPEKRPKKATPYAFTEHGAVMLASVLRNPSAVQMSVMVTRAFIAMRRALSSMLSYDLKIEVINDALDQLREKKEEPGNTIGFKLQQQEGH